jgi:hypothetical protein
MADSIVRDGNPGAWPYAIKTSDLQVTPTGATASQSLAAVAAHGLRATGTLGSALIATTATATQNITVTGAVVGAEVWVGGPSTLEAGLILYAYVSAADTVTLRVHNGTAGSITPAGSQTVSVRVLNPPV